MVRPLTDAACFDLIQNSSPLIKKLQLMTAIAPLTAIFSPQKRLYLENCHIWYPRIDPSDAVLALLKHGSRVPARMEPTQPRKSALSIKPAPRIQIGCPLKIRGQKMGPPGLEASGILKIFYQSGVFSNMVLLLMPSFKLRRTFLPIY